MNTGPKCAALVSHAPHHFRSHPCPHPATKTVGGVPVCGVHARVARKWETQGRLASMAKYWWHWTAGGSA